MKIRLPAYSFFAADISENIDCDCGYVMNGKEEAYCEAGVGQAGVGYGIASAGISYAFRNAYKSPFS